MRRTGTSPVSTCPANPSTTPRTATFFSVISLFQSRLEGKRGGKAFSLAAEKDGFVFESDALIAHLDGGTLCATKVTLNGDVNEAALSGAVEAATLFRLLARKQPFAGPKHK